MKEKNAFVLGGGAFTGFAYETGCILALDGAFEKPKIKDFDMFVGVSCGSMISASLAQGADPELIKKGMEKKSDQVERFSFLKLFKTNIPYFSHIFSHSGSFLPSGLFSGKKVKSYWKKNFEKNNRPDNFMYLKKELYIAATDINTGERVVFGKNENQDAQISSAIQASSAVPFFFESVNIGGRDLVDGIVSGNLPVEVACEHGASLIIGINPFGCFNPKNSAQKIPEMGMIKLLEQSLRLAVKRDIENSAELMRIKYPEVDMIILQPDENNPTAFKYNPLNSGSMKEIMEYAYEETRQRILADYKNMRSILQKHKFILK